MTSVSIEPRTPPRPLPKSIRRGLVRVDTRLKALGLIKGLGTLALILASVTILGVASDVAFVLPQWLRWAIWLTCLATVLLVLARWVIRPLIQCSRWADLAAVAESGNPELGERLTSTVDLLAENANRAHGSPELIAALAEDAGEKTQGIDLGRALSFRPATARLGFGALAILLVLAASIARPDPFGTLLKRFLAPWADVDRVGRFLLEVKPGDRVVALGSDVPVSARVRPRFGSADAPQQAWLEWTDTSGAKQRARMTAESDEPSPTRSFSLVLPRIAKSIQYRVVTDAAQSPRHAITAVEPPSIASLSVSVEPPAYTKYPVAKIKNPARVDAWEGSRVTVGVLTKSPVTHVEVAWPDGPDRETRSDRRTTVALAPPSAQGNPWTAVLEAKASGTYTFILRDKYGLTNAAEPPRRVVVRVDAAPTVAFLDEKAPAESRPDDVLSTEIEARDDLAVVTAEWHYAIQRGKSAAQPEEGQAPVKPAGLGTRWVRGEVELDLKPLKLQPGDVLSYRTKVVDNKPEPDGPNVGWSSIRSLAIVEKAEPMLARKAAADRNEIQAQLNALKKLAAANRQGAEQLRYAADAALRGNGVWDEVRREALNERETNSREVIEKLEVLAKAVEDHPEFAPLERPARQIARVEAEGGREMLDQARRASDATRRLADLRQADGRLAGVQTRLDELQRLFDSLGRLEDDRRKLRSLAQRQENLADRAADLAKDPANRGGDRARLDQIRNEQERLTRELNELMRQSPSLRADVLAEQAREAAKLAEKARELAERQRQEARKTAELNHDDPRLRALLDDQSHLEDDARRLAMEVDLPLQENGRGRLNSAILRRPEEPIQRGDLGQARQTLEQAEDELRRLARDLEDVRQDPKALARRLARRQEQLRDQVRQTVNENVKDRNNPKPEERERVAEALKPLAEREKAISGLTSAIPAPESQRQSSENAAKATQAALQNLEKPELQQTEQRQNQAAEALNRLANELPDLNQRREQARQKLAQARGRAEEVARELERHLRETAPQPGRPQDPDAAAAELARRVAPLAQRQEEVAVAVAELEVEHRADPQHERASRRAQHLADALDAIRDQTAIDEKLEPNAQPAADWHVIGPFAIDANPPMPVTGPTDLKAIYIGRKDAKITWRPVRSEGAQGLVNLGNIYNREENQSAFGLAEIPSASKGKGQLVVGSDDTLTVWLNGKQVYHFDGPRSYSPDQAKVDVDVVEGPNHLVVKCGNKGSEWMYAVALRTPSSPRTDQKPDLRLVRELRSQLPGLQVDERAALDRLEQKLQGRQPADDLAAELAAESNELKSQMEKRKSQNPEGANAARAEQAQEQRRIASALRNLSLPDATLMQAEAVRATERAAKALADSKAEPASPPEKSVHEAAHALEALARRLADVLSPSEQAAALARAQRALDAPDAPRDMAMGARVQRAIADEAARLPQAGHQQAANRTEHAANLAERAVRGDQGDSNDTPPTPSALSQARTQAAEALEARARPALVADQSAPKADALKNEGQRSQAKSNPSEGGDAVAQNQGDSAPNPAGRAPENGKAADSKTSPRTQAEALAARQRAVANQIQAANERATRAPNREAAQKQLDRELAGLAAKQDGLEEDARELPDPHAATAPDRRIVERQRQQAAAAQKRAGQALNKRDPAGAIQQAQRAAEALQRMAQSLPERAADPPRSPAAAPADADLALNDRQAEAAHALAKRERQIRERLQAVLGERVPAQERLRDNAAALGRELAEMRDRSREISPRSHGPANAAADMLQNHAPPLMNQGADHLAQGRASEARESQRRAAEMVEHAAQQAEDLAAALRADRPAEAGEPPANSAQNPAEDSKHRPNLTSAREAQRQAGRQLAQARDPNVGGESAHAASSSMQQAADGLRAAAQSPKRSGRRGSSQGDAEGQDLAGQQPGQPPNSPPGPQTVEPHSAPGGTAEADLTELQAMIRSKTGRKWGELPGHLRSEILQMSKGRYRDDYARLIRLYFREIASEAPRQP
jgi:hypothetical protein